MRLGNILNISNDSENYNADNPLVAFSVATGLLYVIWHKSRGVFGGWQRAQKDRDRKSASIVYKISRDGGLTLSDEKTLYDFKDLNTFGSYNSISPKSRGNRIYLTWVDKVSPNKFEVYFARESEYGDFEQPVALTDATSGLIGDDSGDLRSMVDGEKLSFHNVIPMVADGGNGNVYVMWIESETIRRPPLPEPTITAERKRVPSSFTASTEEEYQRKMKEMWQAQHKEMMRTIPRYEISMPIFLRASKDGGKTFEDKVNIYEAAVQSPGAPYLIGPALMAAAGNNVYIIVNALGESSNLKLFASVDRGSSFRERQGAFQSLEGLDTRIAFGLPCTISGDGDLLYILLTLMPRKAEDAFPMPFQEPKHQNIFARSLDGGITFEFSSPIAGLSGGGMGSPFVLSENGKDVFIAYIDPGRGHELMRTRFKPGMTIEQIRQDVQDQIEKDAGGSVLITSSKDGGLNFEEPVRISNSKHLGPVAEFGVNVFMLPFGTSGLLVMKNRHVNLQNSSQMAVSEGLQDDSQLLAWISNDRGLTFGESLFISEGVRHARGGFGSIVTSRSGSDALNKPPTFYITWTAGSPYGYSDVYLRTLHKDK